MDLRHRIVRQIVNPCLASDQARALIVGSAVGVTIIFSSWHASFTETPRLWAVPVALVIALLNAMALAPIRRSIRTPGILPISVLCSAAAIYACVPETDQMLAVSCSAGIVVVLEGVWRRPLPIVWHASTMSLVLWSGLYGATGRQSALVGALFACLPLPILFACNALCSRLRTGHEFWRWCILGLVALTSVAFARSGGIAATTRPALTWLVVWSGATVAGAAVICLVATIIGRDAQSSPNRDYSVD